MIVCICHRISDCDIARAAQGGCASFDQLQDDLCVATACGACDDCARSTFAHHAALACHPQAAAGAQGAATVSPLSPLTRITLHTRRTAVQAASA